MSQHAPLAPSAAEQWFNCPGSVSMIKSMPPIVEDEAAAEEGTLAHAVAYANVMGMTTPAGATEEMLDGAELWADTMLAYPAQHHFETHVGIHSIHAQCEGTLDGRTWDPTTNTLTIGDYKFGHRYVEVFECRQMLLYAFGVVENHPEIKPMHIEFVIVQPRSYHRDGPVRRWAITRAEFEAYRQIFRDAAALAMSPDAPTVTGSHCRDCKARRACPTLQEASYQIVEWAGKNLPFNMPPRALGKELQLMTEAQALLSSRISGLTDEVMGRVKSGESVPGWMLESSAGRERWSKPLEEVLLMGQMMGVDISKPSAVTPKQAIKAGLAAELVHMYSETPNGASKLVADTGAKSRSAFRSK